MATGTIFVDCPQCGAIASQTYYSRTGERELQCSMCGYDLRSELVVPGKGANEEAPRYRTQVHKGFGAYFLQFKSGVGQMGGLKKELAEADLEKFCRRLADPQVDASRSWLTRWNDRTKNVEVVFGRPEPII
jgi:hypothetical protein